MPLRAVFECLFFVHKQAVVYALVRVKSTSFPNSQHVADDDNLASARISRVNVDSCAAVKNTDSGNFSNHDSSGDYYGS